MLETTYISDNTILIEGSRDHLRTFARLNHFDCVVKSRLFQYRKGAQMAGWIMPADHGSWRGLFDVNAVLVWTLECMVKPL